MNQEERESIKYEVWAIPPNSITDKQRFFQSFSWDRWIWAEKLVDFLEEKGCTKIEIRQVRSGVL